MARTLKTREIGFDNLFKRFAHKEFFIDGMGRLAMAQCNLPTVHHAKPAAVFKTTKQGKKQIKISEYERYRQPEYSSKSDTWLQYFQRWYFRSGLEYMAIPVPSENRVSAQGRAPSKSKVARPFGESPLSEGRAPVSINLMLFSPKIQKNHFF